jgi:Tfp pilus assembly PilM family ATPase
MIKNIFIPVKIGSFYIFTERTVAIKITKSELIAAVVAAHGKRRKIEQLIREPIEQDMLIDYQERATKAITALMSKISSVTNIVAIMPSASIIFKEISVPLMSVQKMKMIVPFELEPLLPYSLDTALIDSVVTHENKETKQADLLVAAIKQDVLDNYLTPFTNAHISPQRVTTDIIELYSLYSAVPEYKNSKETTLLFTINADSTTIGLIVEHQLKAVRVIPKGLTSVSPVTESGESIHLEDPATRAAFDKLLNDITMTAQGFMAKMVAQPVAKMILCGPATEIKDIAEHISSVAGLPCELLTVNKLLYMGATSSKNGLSNEFIVPLAAALQFPISEDFDLNQQKAATSQDSLVGKQIISTAVLILCVLGALLTNSMLTKRSLNKEIKARESEAVAVLKKQLDLVVPKGKTSLNDIMKIAQIEVAKKEDIWFALSSQNRFSFLTYLQELSTRLNREALGLELRQLTVNEDSMSLEGQVKSFPALADFEEALSKSPLFKTVSKPQDVKFSVKIILDKSQGLQ